MTADGDFTIYVRIDKCSVSPTLVIERIHMTVNGMDRHVVTLRTPKSIDVGSVIVKFELGEISVRQQF